MFINSGMRKLSCTRFCDNMTADLRGKTALVTGAGKGIGRAIAKRLGGICEQVFAVSRTQADLDSLKAENPGLETILLDIADWDATRKVIEDIPAVDLLVNNAAVTASVPFLEIQHGLLENVLDINFKAVFNISQVIAKGMVARGNGGSIVNISSVIGLRPKADLSAYCTSKAALEMLTKCMALELAPYKIRANSISPAATNTHMLQGMGPERVQRFVNERMPLGRIGEVDDVVNATVFLLSEHASMITGTSLPVDGGYMIHA